MARYTPETINTSIIPKDWLNNPIMSFNDAQAEADKLQNADLVNQLNEAKLVQDKRQSDAQKQTDTDYAALIQGHKDSGEPESLTPDELMTLATKYDVAKGDIGAAAELQTKEADKKLQQDLAREKFEKPQVHGSVTGGIYTTDEDGNIDIVSPPQKTDPSLKAKTIETYDPNTKSRGVVGSEAEFTIEKAKNPQLKRIDNSISDSGIQKGEFMQDLMSDSPTGGATPSPTPAPKQESLQLAPTEEAMAMAEANKPTDQQKDIIIRPGERVVQDKKGNRFLVKSDGTKTPI